MLKVIPVNRLNLDLQALLELDIKRTRKARALELLITKAACLPEILNRCTVEARFSQTGIRISLDGRLYEDATGPNRKDVAVSGIISLSRGSV